MTRIDRSNFYNNFVQPVTVELKKGYAFLIKLFSSTNSSTVPSPPINGAFKTHTLKKVLQDRLSQITESIFPRKSDPQSKYLAHRFGQKGKSPDGHKWEGWTGENARKHLIPNIQKVFSHLPKNKFEEQIRLTFSNYKPNYSPQSDRVSYLDPNLKNYLTPLNPPHPYALTTKQIDALYEKVKDEMPELIATVNTVRNKKELNSHVRSKKPILLHGGWKGHSVAAYLYWDTQGPHSPSGNWVLARCNKGDKGQPPGIVLYNLKKNPSEIPALAKMILSFDNMTPDKFLFHDQSSMSFKGYIPMKYQKAGNCTVANFNALERAVLFSLCEPIVGSGNAIFAAKGIQSIHTTDSRIGDLNQYLSAHSHPRSRKQPFDISLIMRIGMTVKKKQWGLRADPSQLIVKWAKSAQLSENEKLKIRQLFNKEPNLIFSCLHRDKRDLYQFLVHEVRLKPDDLDFQYLSDFFTSMSNPPTQAQRQFQRWIGTQASRELQQRLINELLHKPRLDDIQRLQLILATFPVDRKTLESWIAHLPEETRKLMFYSTNRAGDCLLTDMAKIQPFENMIYLQQMLELPPSARTKSTSLFSAALQNPDKTYAHHLLKQAREKKLKLIVPGHLDYYCAENRDFLQFIFKGMKVEPLDIDPNMLKGLLAGILQRPHSPSGELVLKWILESADKTLKEELLTFFILRSKDTHENYRNLVLEN